MYFGSVRFFKHLIVIVVLSLVFGLAISTIYLTILNHDLKKQISELEETVAKTPCDLVIVATPIDLRRVMKIEKPSMRVRYELQEIGTPTLEEAIKSVGGIL